MADAENWPLRTSVSDKHYGMFKTTGDDYQKVLTKKAAVDAIQAVNSQLEGYSFVEKVDMGDAGTLNSANDWCLIFWNKDANDYDATLGNGKAVIWTVEKDATKASPDLKPLLDLDQSCTTIFKDSITIVDLNGYDPPY